MSISCSENGAVGAALGTQIFLELVLIDSLPRDDHAEEIVAGGVVGGSDHVAFLTTAGVHDGQGLLGDHAGLLAAQAIELVDAGGGERTGSGRLRKSRGHGTGRVSDERADHASLVRVALLEEGDADELVRRDEVIEELLNVVGEAVPVSVSAIDKLGERLSHNALRGVPDGLDAGVADSLGRAHDGDGIAGAVLGAEGVGLLLKLGPGLLEVEGLNLNVVERTGAGLDRILAVKQNELVLRVHAVLDGDVTLVRGDGNDLVSAEFVAADELLQVRQVLLRVAADEVRGVHAG